MVTISDWTADLEAMTCRNNINNIVVSFEKKGKTLIGKIKDMPIELVEKWAALPHGEENIKNAVMEAEDAFLRAYFEKKN